ncbi:MAG: response regulator [candidate division Zixibacteria bacterium]|nr:response regulator [candidate division Zixibacteria bacterium]
MGANVLIVDDEPDVAKYLAMILRANGFSPTVANSAEEGYEMVSDLKPDLICLDIMMPRESGVSMYQKLRESKDTQTIPVLFISGAEQEDKFDFRAYLPNESIPEPDGYLEKPVDIDKYLAKVRQLTGSNPSEGGQPDR